NGIDLAQTPPHLRDFGLVFQDYGLFPHLNVFDNVAFGLKIRNLPTDKIQLRVAALMEQVNLTGFEKRKVTELSGGEQQRIALARALAPQPRLLMFDEPLGALDRAMKEDLINELRMILHKTKIPAIYVTHDQEEAFTIADRILVLHEGVIIRDGTPDELWKDPQSAVVAKFLGIGNVIEGEVIAENKVKTEFGIFSLTCKHKHGTGEKVSVLLNDKEAGGSEIQLTVEDVLFKRDQFEVKGRGGLIIHMKDAPKIGEVVSVTVQVKCLA
ncbi:MAG: ABC transporter ATP-binding protein, partial [Anaerolineales bacterium]|nr:ABC transporter ATP-binding protein [Anaerolineales bacterium]